MYCSTEYCCTAAEGDTFRISNFVLLDKSAKILNTEKYFAAENASMTKSAENTESYM